VPFVETTLAENITVSTGEGNVGYGAILDTGQYLQTLYSIVIGRYL